MVSIIYADVWELEIYATLKDPIKVANFLKFDASSHVANFFKVQLEDFPNSSEEKS